jgi:DNA-binding transcriptional LysR family regulator
MNLDDLRALVAVAETGSLAKAALRLHITQPAVTRRIQRLEADLGSSLLDRHTKPAGMTRTGRDVYRSAVKMLEAAHELRAGATGAHSAEPVRIGISYAVADTLLGLAVEEVKAVAPGTRLVLSTNRSAVLAKRVATRDLDAAVVCTAHGRSSIDGPFTARDLGREHVIVVAPASYAGPSRTSLEQIAGQSWVINPDGCGFRMQLERALASEGAKLDLAVETWGADLQLSLIARGVGFGLIPSRILATSPMRHFVRTLEVLDFHAAIGLQLIGADSFGAAKLAIDSLGDAITREMTEALTTVAA